MKRLMWISLVVIAGIGGFLLGSRFHSPAIGSSAASQGLTVAGQLGGSQGNGNNAPTATNPTSKEESLILPKSLLLKYWPSPLIDEKVGKFRSMSFFVYGLDLDQSTALVGELNNKVDELIQLELDHSKLITDNQGNQFIAIEEFKEAGQRLQESLREIALNSCKHFPDQRGELLAAALMRTSVFHLFGQFRRELAIEETTSGNTKKYVLRIHSQASSSIKEERNMEMSGNYEAERFQKFVEKHLSKTGN